MESDIGQKILIAIAKMYAQKDGEETSENIKKYSISSSTNEGRQAIIEIAKLSAQQSGRGTSFNIKKYGIDKFPEGQQALIEIAKLSAQQNGRGTSEFIQMYGIDKFPRGQQALIEIVKLAAQQNAPGVSEFIHRYGIKTSTPEEKKAYEDLLHFIFMALVEQLDTMSAVEIKANFIFFEDKLPKDVQFTCAAAQDFLTLSSKLTRDNITEITDECLKLYKKKCSRS